MNLSTLAIFFFTTLAFFTPPSCSAPTPDARPEASSGNDGLAKRAAPTQQEIEQYLQENVCYLGTLPDTVWWTSPGTIDNAAAYAEEIDGSFFGSWFPDDLQLQWSSGLNDEQKSALLETMSAAAANLASGTAYLMLPAGSTARATSTWAMVEYPILERRGITVKAVDPTTQAVRDYVP